MEGGGANKLQNVCMQLRKMANHELLHRSHYATDQLRQMAKDIMKVCFAAFVSSMGDINTPENYCCDTPQHIAW